MSSPDPFTLLKKDHRAVEALFKQLDNTTERAEKTRKELFAELKAALDLHTKIEETILYPALEKVEVTHDITLEAEEEHKVAKTLLGELDAGDETTEEWTAKMTVLMESIQHHVKEEEGDMFPKAQKALSEEEIDKLGEELAEAKGEA